MSLENFYLKKKKLLIKVWEMKEIKYYLRKRYVLRKTALELYLKDGSEILLNFLEKRELEIFLEKLSEK